MSDKARKTGVKGAPKTPGSGRKKGTPNKTTALLKDATIQAAIIAGNKYDPKSKDGLVSYLTRCAIEEPRAFLVLLGKVLPLELTGSHDQPIQVVVQRFGDACE